MVVSAIDRKYITEHVQRALIILAAGSSLENVVKVTVFLSKVDDYNEFNEVYGQYFSNKPPARSCAQVKLIKGMLVEIDAIAFVYTTEKNEM